MSAMEVEPSEAPAPTAAGQKKTSVVRLSNIPYGFFEHELYGYFKQFGRVEKVRVVRSKKGHHNGIAFVEFRHAKVAEIAAQTMDNYLLAENLIHCRVLRTEDLPKSVGKGVLFARFDKPGEAQVRHAKRHFKAKTPLQETRQRKRFIKELRKRMKKITSLGINYEFDFEPKLKAFRKTLEEAIRKRQLEKKEEKEEVKEVEPEVEKRVDESDKVNKDEESEERTSEEETTEGEEMDE